MIRRPAVAALALWLVLIDATASAATSAETPAARHHHAPSPKAAHPVAAKPGPAPPLVGLSPAEARSKLGEPDIAHSEGTGALWTYRLTDCALLLAFREGPKGLRSTTALASPRRRGGEPPSLSVCIAEAETARKSRADKDAPGPAAPSADDNTTP